MSKAITVDIDVTLDNWSVDELREEIESRSGEAASLQKVYEHYYINRSIDAPQILKDYIYQALGKTL